MVLLMVLLVPTCTESFILFQHLLSCYFRCRSFWSCILGLILAPAVVLGQKAVADQAAGSSDHAGGT